jgi:secondary thiamine-phosphate synthase enzyme
MKFFQHDIAITAPSRGCHLITGEIQKTISKDLSQIKIGMCNLFCQHTSASLTINENADPDVRRDMEVALNKIGTFVFLVATRAAPHMSPWKK